MQCTPYHAQHMHSMTCVQHMHNTSFTCKELQEVIEHVGNSEHHFRQQPGGGNFCCGVLEHLDHNGGTCEMVFHHICCMSNTEASGGASHHGTSKVLAAYTTQQCWNGASPPALYTSHSSEQCWESHGLGVTWSGNWQQCVLTCQQAKCRWMSCCCLSSM